MASVVGARPARLDVGESLVTDAMKQFLDSGPVKLISMGVMIGVATASLHAELVLNKEQIDAELAIVRTELRTITAVVCRSSPHDSLCLPAPKE